MTRSVARGSRISRLFRRPRWGLALAGGGCKAFFGLGVAHYLLKTGAPITSMAGTSAGSAMSLAALAGEAENVVEYFRMATARNPANFYWSKFFLGQRPFPHERMYRRTLMTYMNGDFLRKTRVRVAVNTLLVPEHLYPTVWKRAKLLAILASAFRKENELAARGTYKRIAGPLALEYGLQEVVFRNEDLNSDQMIVDAVMAASSVPPMVRFQKVHGRYFLDAGLYNNLPVAHLDPACDLCIAVYYEPISRGQLEQSGDADGRHVEYVAPAGQLPITTWDYTNPDGIDAAFRMGLVAGEELLRRLEKHGWY